ncbi:MAG: mechanosensitive ion channel [Ignavibacteria bacterium]
MLKGIFFLFAFIFSVGQTQTDSMKKSDSDSIKNSELVKSTEILQKYDSVRIADSLYKEGLLKEIESLQSTDNLKKEELVNRLNELSSEDSLRKIGKQRTIDSLRGLTKGYPVALFHDTLFLIYSKVGPFTPKDRALTIQNKIIQLTDDPKFDPDSIRVFHGEQSNDLMYNEIILLSITDNDALWLNKTRDEASDIYREKIIDRTKQYIDDNSFKNTLFRIGLAALTILGLFLILKYVNKFFNWIRNKFEVQKENWIKGIKIKDYELLTHDRISNIIKLVLKFVKIFVLLLTSYFFLTILFGIFPSTKGIAGTLLGYILDPLKKIWHSAINFLPNLLTIIVIIFVTRYVIKFVKFLTKEVETGSLKIPGFYEDWAKPTYNIVRFVIYAFMFIVIFPYLPGSDSPIFQGVTVLLGLIFSFGSTSAVSNIIAGIVITYMRPFKIGDRVKIGEVTGDIVHKDLLVTRVRTIKNEDVTVPNSTILSNYITNYSSSAENLGLIIHTTVTIGYDAPWKKVHELLINAALATNGILKNPSPFVLQTSLDDWYVSYQINAYTDKPNGQAGIYSELHSSIQEKFNEGGIEIMSPHYHAMRDGNTTTIPENYLDGDYQAPSFRVKNNGESKK